MQSQSGDFARFNSPVQQSSDPKKAKKPQLAPESSDSTITEALKVIYGKNAQARYTKYKYKQPEKREIAQKERIQRMATTATPSESISLWAQLAAMVLRTRQPEPSEEKALSRTDMQTLEPHCFFRNYYKVSDLIKIMVKNYDIATLVYIAQGMMGETPILVLEETEIERQLDRALSLFEQKPEEMITATLRRMYPKITIPSDLIENILDSSEKSQPYNLAARFIELPHFIRSCAKSCRSAASIRLSS